jgi:transcriptional regulator with XRE-family HTH domain
MPKKRKQKVTGQLRAAVDADPRSRYELANLVGMQQSAMSRFMSGERGLSIEALESLCEVLGLELRPVDSKRKG